MNPILELVLKDDPEKVVAVACGKCRIVRLNQTEAERCCRPYKCDMCSVEIEERGWMRCKSCREKVQAKQDQERFDKAKKIQLKDYDFEYVCIDGNEVTSSVEDILDRNEGLDPDDDDYIRWAWACHPQSWPHFDAHDIIYNHCEDLFEDASDDLDAPSLQKALDEWLAAQGQCTWHISDESRVVIFAPGWNP